MQGLEQLEGDALARQWERFTRKRERKAMTSNRWLATFVSLVLAFSPMAASAQSGAASQEAQAQQPAPAQPATPAEAAAKYRMHLSDQDYTNGPSTFPNIFKPYMQIRLPQEAVENAPSVDQMIQGGKLVLSLQDAVQLALQNNLDISVQRFVTYQADAAVLSAKSGPGFLTPTGQFVSFDPFINASTSWYRSSTPINNPFTSGTGASGLTALNTQQATGNVSYGQGFPTGSAFSVSLNNTRTSQTPTASFFNPAINSTMTVSFQQNLLQGFGFGPNLRFLRVARINRKQADLQFEQQVITTVVATMTQYYELVFAQQDVGVKEKSLALNEKLYNDNKRQVEIGTLAPIEITRAASEVAAAKGALITAQTLALQQETLLKQLIFRNVMDSRVAEISIVPTDKPDENLAVPDIGLAAAVGEASAKRPDVKQAVLAVDASKIVVNATRNLLLPALTLSAQYSTQGLGGNLQTFTPNGIVAGTDPIVTTGGDIICAPGATPTATPTTMCPAGTQPIFTSSIAEKNGAVIPGGIHQALAQVFQSNFPTYGVSLNLALPLRNRLNQAANITALLQEKQNVASLQRLRNSVTVDVRNAQITLMQDKAAVEADIRARILAEQTLDAEQKKFLLGASTPFLVIQAERDLATARSTEVRALANLAEAKVNFDRALGRTLEVNRIDVADAKHPPMRVPLIPGTPSSELNGSVRNGEY
jgi:outer membrane protein TolC